MEFRVVIPARYASTRLPGKPLLDIGGLPMIQRVVERACASAATEVLVATDDERIAAVVRHPRNPGARIAVLTDAALASGTDRVAAVAAARGWPDSLIVVNVQGDEPFLPSQLIDQAAATLAADPGAEIATLATPIGTLAEFIDPNVVKVVTDLQGRALYFSRAAIPFTRDVASRTRRVQSSSAAPCGTSDCMRTVQAHCAASCSSRRRRWRHGRDSSSCARCRTAWRSRWLWPPWCPTQAWIPRRTCAAHGRALRRSDSRASHEQWAHTGSASKTRL